MFNNIRNKRYKMKLATNSGTRMIEEQYYVTGFGKVMFLRDSIENIFSLIDLNNVCRFAYDYTKQDAFVALMYRKQFNFQCN